MHQSGSLLALLSVARAFLYLAELRIEKRNRHLANWVLRRKITLKDLVAADLDNDGLIRYDFQVLLDYISLSVFFCMLNRVFFLD